jgi:integrase
VISLLCIKCKAEIPDHSVYCNLCGKRQTPEKRKALKRANGTGTVYKIQGRRKRPWVAAKNKVILGYYEKKTDAIEALERLSGKKIEGRINMTFAEVYQEWSEEHFKTIGPSGITSYQIAFRLFSPLHNRQFRSLRTKDFQEVIDRYMDKSYSTLSKYKQLLTQMSTWAIREEILSTNFGKFVRLKENSKKEKEIFTEEDIKKLETDSSETAKVILMLIYTGMRIGELFSLVVSDYHVEYVIGGEKTEAGRNRIIPIPNKARKYFQYFADQAESEILLSGYVGNQVPANFRKRDYYPLLEKLKIPKRNPHCTRHTFTSMAVKAGVQPEILQKVLGHADYSTTANIYVHADSDSMIEEIDKAFGY